MEKDTVFIIAIGLIIIGMIAGWFKVSDSPLKMLFDAVQEPVGTSSVTWGYLAAGIVVLLVIIKKFGGKK